MEMSNALGPVSLLVPAGERIACACQIGTPVACQRGGVARQAEADPRYDMGFIRLSSYIALLSSSAASAILGQSMAL